MNFNPYKKRKRFGVYDLWTRSFLLGMMKGEVCKANEDGRLGVGEAVYWLKGLTVMQEETDAILRDRGMLSVKESMEKSHE